MSSGTSIVSEFDDTALPSVTYTMPASAVPPVTLVTTPFTLDSSDFGGWAVVSTLEAAARTVMSPLSGATVVAVVAAAAFLVSSLPQAAASSMSATNGRAQ